MPNAARMYTSEVSIRAASTAKEMNRFLRRGDKGREACAVLLLAEGFGVLRATRWLSSQVAVCVRHTSISTF